MINNGDAIGRLKALLHLRGAHDRSSSRERVAGDLLRLRGIMGMPGAPPAARGPAARTCPVCRGLVNLCLRCARRVQGPACGNRRVAVSHAAGRYSKPRLQGNCPAVEPHAAECLIKAPLAGEPFVKNGSPNSRKAQGPACGEPWGKVPFRAGRGNLAFRPVSERAPSVRPSEQSERIPSTRTPHQSERLASTRTPYNRNGLPPHSLPTS